MLSVLCVISGSRHDCAPPYSTPRARAAVIPRVSTSGPSCQMMLAPVDSRFCEDGPASCCRTLMTSTQLVCKGHRCSCIRIVPCSTPRTGNKHLPQAALQRTAAAALRHSPALHLCLQTRLRRQNCQGQDAAARNCLSRPRQPLRAGCCRRTGIHQLETHPLPALFQQYTALVRFSKRRSAAPKGTGRKSGEGLLAPTV